MDFLVDDTYVIHIPAPEPGGGGSAESLLKSEVVDESLSTTTTRVLFQRETTYLLQETTE